MFFNCDVCNIKCKRIYELNKHKLTNKHKMNSERSNFRCNCGKIYKKNSGLVKHKTKCLSNNDTEYTLMNDTCSEINNDIISDNICDINNISNIFHNENILELVKQNKEFKELLLEQNKIIVELSKSMGSLNINNNNNNNNNKTFNIQMFLNEKCKDALTMNQFIESLKITMDDVERFGTEGFIEGITKIFVKNIKMLDISKRPVHCSDLKREVIYIKEDDNTWQKDNENKETMKKTINKIAHKNFLRIQDWREKNPEYKDPESKVNDRYQQIMFESMGGYTKEENEKNFAKIIRNVSKEITIDKSL